MSSRVPFPSVVSAAAPHGDAAPAPFVPGVPPATAQAELVAGSASEPGSALVTELVRGPGHGLDSQVVFDLDSVVGRGEAERLLAVQQLDFLCDPELEAEHRRGLNRICELARALLKVDAAMVSLVFENDQRFVARSNIHETGTPRDISFCTRAIQQRAPLVVGDATQDPRFASNPLVTGPMNLRFYAGIPLEWSPGQRIGTLCVIDAKPKQPTAEQMEAMHHLANLVLDHLRLLVSLRELRSREHGVVEPLAVSALAASPTAQPARLADTHPSESTSSKGSVDQ